jgi:vacuolar-type H+-ATPase subunit I/STV1
MSKKQENVEVEYESLLGVKTVKSKSKSLADLMQFDDEEKQKLKLEEEDFEWQKHWKGMPEYDQPLQKPYKTLQINFKTKEDYDNFAKLIDQPLTEKTKVIWHPQVEKTFNYLLRWVEGE